MPLLNKKAFHTEPHPLDLKDDEEVFVCRQTNEVYRDYESYFKRTILCNSLVWSCEITLKHGLTYEEAAESEEEAKEIVKKISEPIRRGVLTLVHYTRHSRLDNLCDDVFNYIRERYQEGEEIEVKHKGEKFVGFIHNVIEPKALANGIDSPRSKTNPKPSPSKKPNKHHKSPGKMDVDMTDLNDEDGAKNKSGRKNSTKSKADSVWPDVNSYQYVVKLKRTQTAHAKTLEFITVNQFCISRKKGSFTRDKLKLLLRMTCYRTNSNNEQGYWRVKDTYREKYELSADVDEVKFTAENTTKKRKRKEEKGEKRKKAKKTESNKKKSLPVDSGKETAPKLSREEIERIKEESKQKREKEKEIRKQERDKARLERSELLKEQKMFLLHWCVPQEDLKLDDHKELPKYVPLETDFPPEMFSDMIMVLEFLYIFGEFFNGKQDFPDGISIEILEKALTEHDAEGSFYDIVRFLLSSILTTHAEEKEEEGLDDIDHQKNMKSSTNDSCEKDEDNDITRVKKAVSASATMAAAWAQVHQGKDLHKLTLDSFTCSEILRLHFLSSGASLGGDSEPYRWQRRGGFTLSDDVCIAFRHEERAIMRGLVTGNIYDLNAVEKLKILKTLCAQLLTYATTRDYIDDGFDRLRRAKRGLQEEQWADQRKDKKEAKAKYQKRMEEKAKEKENKAKIDSEKQEKQIEKTISGGVTSNGDVYHDGKAHTRSQGPVAARADVVEHNEDRERVARKEILRKREKIFLKEIKKSLFVEDSDPHLPQLLQLDEEDDDELSDGESSSEASSVTTEEDAASTSTTPAIPHNTFTIKSLSRKQIEQEKDLCRILKLYNIPQDSLPKECALNTGVQSLKLEQIYARLKNREIMPWSYIVSKDDLDLLLNSLNPRGCRERNLRDALLQSYDAIVRGLENNPFKAENKQRKAEMRSQCKPNVSGNESDNKALYKTMEDFIEASLRDQILDLEDRIWQGGLGFVKVDDIAAWRKDVENGIYDQNITVENIKREVNEANGDVMEASDQSTMSIETPDVTESMVVDQPHSLQMTDLQLKLLSNHCHDRPGTPVDGSFASTPTSSQTPPTINPCVRSLATAVLQIERGIERKYLIPPLGGNDVSDDKKRKESGHEKTKAKTKKTLMERWQDSLMSCTNLAQVFIHLSNLDNCISWDKSVLNARCRICRRKGDAEHMLLCDGCDKGHHMYCLKPPLTEVPEGDWFCSQCRSADPRRSVRRQKREESGDEGEDRRDMKLMEMNSDDDEGGVGTGDESENDADDGGTGDEDDSEDNEESENESVEDEEAQSSDDAGSVHMETCAFCENEGELLCCETCPLVYHLECVYPPLRRVPRGEWSCQVCSGADQELPSGRRIKKAVIKGARQLVNQQSKKITSEVKSLKMTRNSTKTTRRRHNQSIESDTPPRRESSRNSTKPAKTTRIPAGLLRKCEKLLKELKDHNDSWPFLTPVDSEVVPDYHSVIKCPMDLQTIENKLLDNEYGSTDEFMSDVRQIFFNCSEYNQPRSREAKAGIRLSAFFETRFEDLGLDCSEPRGPRTRRSR